MTTAPLTINYAIEMLPLFSRTGWSRVRFGDVVENVNETEGNPMAVGIERYIGLGRPQDLSFDAWANSQTNINVGITKRQRTR